MYQEELKDLLLQLLKNLPDTIPIGDHHPISVPWGILSIGYLCKREYLCKKLIWRSQILLNSLVINSGAAYLMHMLCLLFSRVRREELSTGQNRRLVLDRFHQK